MSQKGKQSILVCLSELQQQSSLHVLEGIVAKAEQELEEQQQNGKASNLSTPSPRQTKPARDKILRRHAKPIAEALWVYQYAGDVNGNSASDGTPKRNAPSNASALAKRAQGILNEWRLTLKEGDTIHCPDYIDEYEFGDQSRGFVKLYAATVQEVALGGSVVSLGDSASSSKEQYQLNEHERAIFVNFMEYPDEQSRWIVLQEDEPLSLNVVPLGSHEAVKRAIQDAYTDCQSAEETKLSMLLDSGLGNDKETECGTKEGKPPVPSISKSKAGKKKASNGKRAKRGATRISAKKSAAGGGEKKVNRGAKKKELDSMEGNVNEASLATNEGEPPVPSIVKSDAGKEMTLNGENAKRGTKSLTPAKKSTTSDGKKEVSGVAKKRARVVQNENTADSKSAANPAAKKHVIDRKRKRAASQPDVKRKDAVTKSIKRETIAPVFKVNNGIAGKSTTTVVTNDTNAADVPKSASTVSSFHRKKDSTASKETDLKMETEPKEDDTSSREPKTAIKKKNSRQNILDFSWICTECNEAECDADPEAVLIICEGGCNRPFHYPCANLSSAPSSDEDWVCEDCQKGRHRCALCEEYGTDGEEVFCCDKGDCGLFFHESCLSMQNVEIQVSEKRISSSPEGIGLDDDLVVVSMPHFVCPAHTCWTCTEDYVPSEDDDGEETTAKKKKTKGRKKKKSRASNSFAQKRGTNLFVSCFMKCDLLSPQPCLILHVLWNRRSVACTVPSLITLRVSLRWLASMNLLYFAMSMLARTNYQISILNLRCRPRLRPKTRKGLRKQREEMSSGRRWMAGR